MTGLGLTSTPIYNTAWQRAAGAGRHRDRCVQDVRMVGGALGVALLSAIARGFPVADSSDAVTAVGLTRARSTRRITP